MKQHESRNRNRHSTSNGRKRQKKEKCEKNKRPRLEEDIEFEFNNLVEELLGRSDSPRHGSIQGNRENVRIHGEKNGRLSDSYFHNQVVDGVQEIGGINDRTTSGRFRIFKSCFIRALRGISFQSRVVHDIYEGGGTIAEIHWRRFLSDLGKNIGTRKTVIAICKHGEHFHCVHLCKYRKSYCGCEWLKRITEKKIEADQNFQEEIEETDVIQRGRESVRDFGQQQRGLGCERLRSIRRYTLFF